MSIWLTLSTKKNPLSQQVIAAEYTTHPAPGTLAPPANSRPRSSHCRAIGSLGEHSAFQTGLLSLSFSGQYLSSAVSEPLITKRCKSWSSIRRIVITTPGVLLNDGQVHAMFSQVGCSDFRPGIYPSHNDKTLL